MWIILIVKEILMSPLDSSPDTDYIRFWFRLGLSVRSLLKWLLRVLLFCEFLSDFNYWYLLATGDYLGALLSICFVWTRSFLTFLSKTLIRLGLVSIRAFDMKANWHHPKIKQNNHISYNTIQTLCYQFRFHFHTIDLFLIALVCIWVLD